LRRTILKTAPVLFISHGAPTFALEPGLLGPKLANLGQRLSDVKALLVVSTHWQTPDVAVMTTASPRTLHDFGGFPSEPYEIQYPPADIWRLPRKSALGYRTPGSRCNSTIDAGSITVRGFHCDFFRRTRAFLFQVSLPHDLDAAGALRLGEVHGPVARAGSGDRGFREPHSQPV
jgi:4,5-DOPA dioxygenase extradiol